MNILIKFIAISLLIISSAFANDGSKTMSLEELAKYDGKNGNPAYVAVDGVIYDVSSLGKWKNGSHAGGKAMAGKDMSDVINSSPHGKSKLKKLKVVGKLK